MELKTKTGIVFQIDESDLPLLEQYPHWYGDSDGYIRVAVEENEKGYRGDRKLLHRLVTRCPPDKIVDHINHNKTDCRRVNLRVCSRAQNNQNIKKTNKPNHTSKYKGVRWHQGDQKWEARIQINRKQIFLGQYTSEILAAERYDDAAVHFFQQFALLNFPNRTPHEFQMQQPLKRHSKHRGISFDKTKKSRPWTACLQVKGTRWQERFETEALALQALQTKRSELVP